MSLEFREIAQKVAQRRRTRSPVIAAMDAVRSRYNGDIVIALPNVEDEAALPPMTPALIADAVDGTARRAASVIPNITCPAVDPSKPDGIRSLDWAETRRNTLRATWRLSRMPLALRRGFRHLSAYAATALVVVPDFDTGYPCVKARDPLTAFPEPKAPEDITPPLDCAFVYGKSREWLLATYGVDGSPRAGEVRRLLADNRDLNRFSGDMNELWDVIEWIDGDEIVTGIGGPRFGTREPWGTEAVIAELSRGPNRAGVCTAVIPEAVTLDRIASNLANLVGITDLMAKLMSLDIAATEKSIWPDRYVIGREGRQPRIVGGGWKDGRSGEVNLLQDVQAVGELQSSPNPSGMHMIESLERNYRISSGLAPQMGGESYGSARSGRQIDAILNASVDPRVQEQQEIMQVALEQVNRVIFSVYEGYWPRKKFVTFTGLAGEEAHVSFTPNVELAESHENSVFYPILGADITQTTVSLGQLNGAKFMSRRTARTLHPHIVDAAFEERQTLVEDLDDAMKTSLLERAASGGLPPADFARLKQLVAGGRSLEEAVMTVDREAQERQAAAAPAPGPGQVTAPEAQPGLANVGEGAGQQLVPGQGTGYGPQSAGNPIGPPPQGLQNLKLLLSNLRAQPPARQAG